MIIALGGAVAVATLVTLAILTAFALRRIVPPNYVHIVQRQKTSLAFGHGQKAGNVYYEWPSFLPVFGVTVRKFPTSNFNIEMPKYPAYDKDRVPFEVDLTAFLRIDDPIMAAQRIENFNELKGQIQQNIESAVRTVLGSFDIHEIMLQRTTLGDKFTQELGPDLKEWGVVAVRDLALTDVRDLNGSKEGPISRIMAEKTSEIEAKSRRIVAEQQRLAQVAEIENKQIRDVREQEAKQITGQREAQQVQAVGIAQEKAKQEIAVEAKETKARDMAVIAVATQQQAIIHKDAAVVKAEEEQQVAVIQAQAAKNVAITRAEGEKQQTVLVAEGHLEEAKREAEGIKAKGEAQGAADTAVNLAVVQPQITLAKEIGGNPSYQKYLTDIRAVEKDEAVGIEQAKALGNADTKIIVNGGSVQSGINSVGDLLSSKGGTAIGGLLEGLAQSEEGQRILALLPQVAAQAQTTAPKTAAKGNGKAGN